MPSGNFRSYVIGQDHAKKVPLRLDIKIHIIFHAQSASNFKWALKWLTKNRRKCVSARPLKKSSGKNLGESRFYTFLHAKVRFKTCVSMTRTLHIGINAQD